MTVVPARRRSALVRAAAAAVVLALATPAFAGGCDQGPPVTRVAANGQQFRWEPGYG